MPHRDIRYSMTPAAVMTAAQDALEDALKEAASHWYREMMPRHFEEEATQRYGYQLRSGQDETNLVYGRRGRVVRNGAHGRLVLNQKYYWRKLRSGHGKRPLVYSGDSENMIKAGVRIRSKRDPGGQFTASAVMRAPKYFYQYTANAPRKVEELTAVTSDERQELASIVNSTAEQRLRDAVRAA